MSEARAQILGAIRHGLGRGPLDDGAKAALDDAIAPPPPGPVPARAQAPHGRRVEMFADKARAVDATVARVASLTELPGAVAGYLAGLNLPAELVVTDDPWFDGAPWAEQTMLTVRRGVPDKSDPTSVTHAFAGVAETGSLLLLGDERNPHRASFLPETNIVVIAAARIVGGFEEAWARLREAGGAMPRTACFITGPSRTGDIEQRIELGAHGPRRLHVVIVDDAPA